MLLQQAQARLQRAKENHEQLQRLHDELLKLKRRLQVVELVSEMTSGSGYEELMGELD